MKFDVGKYSTIGLLLTRAIMMMNMAGSGSVK